MDVRISRARDDVEKLMTLCEADITSGIEQKVKRFLENFALVREKMKDLEERDRIRNFQPPITGDIIMKCYNLTPCAVIGEIKDAGMTDKVPSGIVLTGGGSLLKGIDSLFEERTGYEVRLASAEFNISDESKELVSDPRFATAAGLLLMAQNPDLLTAHSEQHIEGDAVIRTNINPIETPIPDFTDDDKENNIEDEEFIDDLPKKKRKPRKEKEKKEKKESNNGEGRLKNKVSNWFNSWFGVVDDDDESFN